MRALVREEGDQGTRKKKRECKKVHAEEARQSRFWGNVSRLHETNALGL